jgi:hypothetical protein
MRTTFLKALESALLLSFLGFVLVNASASKNDPTQRIANYKEWTRVTSQLPPSDTITLVGG